jgi:hypothetical protein
LNKEWLADYKAHEEEEYKRFLKQYAGGKIEYPPRTRFNKMKNPIVDTTNNIWSLIPFYGSSLIHIHPMSQESSIRDFGWGSDNDINNLLQLSKDTGKAQFILDKSPLDYEQYDYLESILRERRPPVIKLFPDLLFGEKDFTRAKNEYDTLSGYKFDLYIRKIYEELKNTDVNYSSYDSFAFKFRFDYATLRLSGYGELADLILDAMIDNPKLTFEYFLLFGVILTPPKSNSFNISYNPVLAIDGDLLRERIDSLSTLTQQIPALNEDLRKNIIRNDVGELLFKKLIPGVDGYLGCISLMDKYQQVDLSKLLGSVQQGINEKNINLLKSGTNQLSSALDDIWNETKISRSSSGIDYGIPLLLGAIGTLAAQEIGGIVGYWQDSDLEH